MNKLRICALLIAFSSMLAWRGTAFADPAVRVGRNVHVSAARPNDDHFEVRIGADPLNARNLVACSHIGTGNPTFVKTVNYVSTNGGETWRLAFSVGSKKESGDPECGFGLQHRLYAVSLEPDKGDRGVMVFRSSDLGRSWRGPATAKFIDREYLTVDRSGGKYNGRIYINGTGYFHPFDPGSEVISAASVYHSSDNGASLQTAAFDLSSPTHWIIGPSNGVVLSNGTFGFAFPEMKARSVWTREDRKANAWLKFITSADGGESFNSAVVAADWAWCKRGSLVPSLASDATRGPFRDRLYAAYPDSSSGRCDIALVHSSDQGKTWSSPTIVDSDVTERPGAGPDNLMPTVVVNNQGVVGVLWYDRREDPNDVARTVRFAASVDGGSTFGRSVRISNAANVPSWNNRYGPLTGFADPTKGGGLHVNVRSDFEEYVQGGDTGGLTAGADGVFHALWPDNRTNISQLWTAPITVDARAYRNGDPALDSYADVTSSVALTFDNIAYDPKSRTVSMTAQIKNNSKKPLRMPLLMRAAVLRSKWGDAAALSSDNGQTRAGVVWRFPVDNSAAELAPNAKSKPVRLVFGLSNLKSPTNELLEQNTGPQGLVEFEARILSQP